MNKKIIDYKKYNYDWPKQFQIEKTKLLGVLPVVVEIEHIGSTAIPEMPGKGIIDILIVTESELEEIAKQLEAIGLISRENAGSVNRIFFSDKPLEDSNVKFHYHLVKKGTNDHLNPIKFRDYLISHPEAAKEYAEIKENLASTVTKSRDYLKGKSEFINNIISK